LLFLLKDGSTVSLAKRDLTDVGISSALPLALASSVFSRLPPLSLPCGWDGHERRGPEKCSVSMFCLRSRRI
jgi:hypothetical protein